MPAPSNIVQETSTSTSTGNFTVASVFGRRTFNTAFGTGGTDVFDYFILSRDANEWEIGTGHLSTATTLVRDTVVSSSNADALVNFSAGTKDVNNDVPSGDVVTVDSTASTTAAGIVELATDAETQTGTDTARAITPANLTAKEASSSEYRNNTADRILTTDQVWTAAGLVTLTDAATVAVDLDTGINFEVTLAGNRTLGNPTNTQVGQAGIIIVNQDGTGSRTLAYGANWEFPGGAAPTLTTTASAKDILFYFVQTATSILVTGVLKDVA